MEEEMKNFTMAYTIVVLSLTYCYIVSSRIPKGYKRLISLLPIISIFTLTPLLLSSAILQLTFGLLIAWLANFKLFLFAFARDDTLTIDPSMSLLHFIILTTLALKIKPSKQTPSSVSSRSIKISDSFWLNTAMWCVAIGLYIGYTQRTPVQHPIIIHFLYTYRLISAIQFTFQGIAPFAELLLGQEVEQQFNNPFLSTSVQDFWGKRWNLMFSAVLRSAVHEPVKNLFTPILGRRWALHPALLITFFTSGLMHELTYFYVTRVMPTWEVTWFFVINAICVSIEFEVKKKGSEKGWRLHPVIQRLWATGFLHATSFWCFAELINCGADAREVEEYISFSRYIKNILYA